ncbi:response regulator [Psychromonas sp. PT13]|uniref:response regulator n=1 Tax=Psychromonas sp. PT13 TaxID=3439547 RepID=UPI003EBADB66
MIKLALIDDHVIVRSGFAQLLSLEKDIDIVGEYGSAAEASKGLAINNATICILDISMPDKNGLELLSEISHRVDCIMLSVHESSLMIEKALDLGAKGFLSKRCSPDEMLLAVRTVAQGHQYLAPDLALKIANSSKINCFKQLTKREHQVGEMLSRGLDIKTIATQLGLSSKTVHIHRANAMDKLNVDNNVKLAKYFDSELI